MVRVRARVRVRVRVRIRVKVRMLVECNYINRGVQKSGFRAWVRICQGIII